MIYGVFLPKDVLEKIYFKNAERLLVGLKPGLALVITAPAPLTV